MQRIKPPLTFHVEATVFNYDTGSFELQRISQDYHTHKEAKCKAFLARFDFPDAREVLSECNSHLSI